MRDVTHGYAPVQVNGALLPTLSLALIGQVIVFKDERIRRKE